MSHRILTAVLSFASLAANAIAQTAPEGAQRAAEHAADAAHAVHEKAGVLPNVQQGIAPMIVSLVVFGLVLAILSVKVWPGIVKGLKDREEKIKSEIEAAEMARHQAKDALEQYQQSLSQARAEAQKMIDAARQQQQTLAAQLKAESEVELAAMREKARRDIESAKRAAISEIYAESTNLAAMIAGKILKRDITAGDSQALMDESVKQLATLKN